MVVVLDRDQVDGIRAAIAGGMAIVAAATEYSLPITTIRAIASGRLTGRPVPPAELAERWRAACMTPKEWAAWQDTNRRISNHTDQAPRPCSDCTLGFAADMRAVDRCNGSPAGADHEEENDMDPQSTAEPKVPTRQVRIAVDAPCGGCSHAEVCRIADEVRAIAEAKVEVPRVGDGLTLALAGSIECRFYAPVRKAGRPAMTPEQRAAAAARLAEGQARKAAERASAG
jgi:hypothetical protein